MKTKIQWIKKAQKMGSTCTTFADAKKWILSHPVSVHEPWLSRSRAYPWLSRIRADQYRTTEAARKANPDAKRARHDVSFRRNWLRRINADLHRLRNPPVGTLIEISAAADSWSDRQQKINELLTQKSIALGKVQPAIELPRITAGVPVGNFSADFARHHGADICMVGKDATIQATRRTSHGIHIAATPSTRTYRGNWTGFKRAQHDNYVRSLALVRADARTVDYVFHETFCALTLPDEMHWDVDSNGLRAVSGPDDYHPTLAELLAKNAAEIIAQKLSANAATRKKHAAEKLAEEAEMQGVYVCVADSLRAGNCLAGTQSFAERHNLDVTRHYSALEILAQGNGDTSRVRLAIRAAINHNRADCERGYSILSEHTVNFS